MEKGSLGLLPLLLKGRVDKEELLDTRIDQTRTLPDQLSDRHRKNVHFLVDERKITRQMRCTLLSSSFICFLLVFSIGKSWEISFVFSFIELSRYWDESIVFPTTWGFYKRSTFPVPQTTFIRSSGKRWKKKKIDLFVYLLKRNPFTKRRIN